MSWILVIYTIVNSLGILIDGGSLDGILQSITSVEERVLRVLQLGFFRQFCIAIGSLTAGWLLEHSSLQFIMFTISILVALQTCLILRFPATGTVTNRNPRRIVSSLLEGGQYLIKNKAAIHAILGILFAVSVAQITNLILPSFVKTTLFSNSKLFGILEGAWAIGGASFLLFSSTRCRFLRNIKSQYIVMTLLGFTMFCYINNKKISLSILLFGCLGGLFALLRGLSNGKLLEVIENNKIGRVQGVATTLASFSGVLIYLISSFIVIKNVQVIYSGWAIIVILAAIILFRDRQTKVSLTL